MSRPENLLEDVVARVLEVLGQILPASTLARFSDQLRPAIDRVLAPFQILRREDFDGYLAQLERLESEVDRLEVRIAELEGTKDKNPP